MRFYINLVALRVESNINEVNLTNRKSNNGSYNSKLMCKKKQDHQREDIRKLCNIQCYKRKLSGDIEGLSKATSRRIKSVTCDDYDSNPDVYTAKISSLEQREVDRIRDLQELGAQ